MMYLRVDLILKNRTDNIINYGKIFSMVIVKTGHN